MRLPYNLLTKTYTKPDIYLCETDKQKISKLETNNTQATFKFNSYSEISFEVARTYNDLITGETKVNPFYDKIEALRLINVDNFGYFEIQGPALSSDGIKEVKNVTAYSLEYTLSQKYLEKFYINTGEVDSKEVIYATDKYGDDADDNIEPVTLYNKENHQLSLLHLALEKIYGWDIGQVDDSLKTLSRKFEVDRQSVYDFLMNEVCAKFNCYIEFDTINNLINVYAESRTSRFIGDGRTNTFTISPPFSDIGTLSIDGYKVSNLNYKYDKSTGALVLTAIPAAGAVLEIVDKGLDKWETDVFVSFDNLSQEINIDYDADSIKTVLTVTYGEDENIREANLGVPYLTDISYYYTVDWMGQELYDAYTAYLQKTNESQNQYTTTTQQMTEVSRKISFEEYRLSLDYSEASVFAETVGTYYVRGGESPNYYYSEVSLPADYNVNTTYYKQETTNLDEAKIEKLYNALKKYFNNENKDDNTGDTKLTSWKTDMLELKDSFSFVEKYTIEQLVADLDAVKLDRIGNSEVKIAIMDFLTEVWIEVGRYPLQSIYLKKYETAQTTGVSAGHANVKNENYGLYYPVVIMIQSLELEIKERDEIIGQLEEDYSKLQKSNTQLANDLVMDTFFTNYFKKKYLDENEAERHCEMALVRLNAFLREDELHLDDIVTTSQDSLAESIKVKQNAMESGRIELQKLCQPQLSFSMNMANIYALSEFKPIIDQFQLGKVIKVGLRSDYIKQSRLMEVNINFDDFSDFSCVFGDLTSLRTQSDIHADLLSQAVSAGKEVATYSSYWTQGSDTATATDLKIEKGLLDATTQIKAMDGTQNVVIDKYGIKLQKVLDPETGELDPKQGWIVNNQFLYSDDGFESTKAVFGEYKVDNQTYWGLLAEAVIAGYIEGSKIEGGTIKIGEYKEYPGKYAFEVDKHGNVFMQGGLIKYPALGKSSLDTAVENLQGQISDSTANLQGQINTSANTLQNAIDNINNKQMYDVQVICNGPTSLSSDSDKTMLHCKVYAWDTDVTEQQDASNFQWHRTSATTNGFNGDGTTRKFVLTNIGKDYKFGAVFIDNELYANYEDTTKYTYNTSTHALELTDTPAKDAIIEVVSELDYNWDCAHSGMKSIEITHHEVNDMANISCKFTLPEGQEKEEQNKEE